MVTDKKTLTLCVRFLNATARDVNYPPFSHPPTAASETKQSLGGSVLCGAFVWGSNSSNATTGAGHSATEDKSSITLSTGDGDGDLLANFGKVVAL